MHSPKVSCYMEDIKEEVQGHCKKLKVHVTSPLLRPGFVHMKQKFGIGVGERDCPCWCRGKKKKKTYSKTV